ncbi:hypothetical protein [Nocardioides sp. LS1]|uniref:hypothetical protein n=1 Tax=Nocardioides sp. LS1 TaxID=1027620 RepID=UPI000F61DAF3|nr:hypothetical protein [Nocardioides sp. LS1]GCD91587.1 hypothetical protein NLS1_35930 [Nocardioides sp. LS1]
MIDDVRALLRRWSLGQWVLRATMALAPVLALAATGLAGTAPRALLVVLVAALSVTYAGLPEGPFGTTAMGLVVVWWGFGLRDGLQPACLLAAALLLAAHVAGLLVAYGPDALPVDRGLLLLWLRRSGLALLLAPSLYVLAVLVRGHEAPGVWVVGLAAALVAVLVATVAFTGQE